MFKIGVGKNRVAADAATVDDDSGQSTIGTDFDFFHVAADSNVDSVLDHLVLHLVDEFVRAALEGVDTFAHEVGKDYSVSDRRVFQRRAVCVRDRLHQKPDDVIATGEEFLEQFASRHVLVVVEIHLPREGEELVDRFMSDAEFLGDDPREVFSVESGFERKLRILEANAF